MPTPEYWTVLKMLLAVIRASKFRVSPSDTVRDSDPLVDTVPGPSIELREALPYVPGAGAEKAAVLNQLFSDPVEKIETPGTRFGRNEFPAPAAISAEVPE